MKIKKRSLILIMFFMVSSFMIVSPSGSQAAGPYEPYLNYAGNFSYTDSSHLLSFSNITMSQVTYLDTSTYLCASSSDPICGASITIGDLFNTPSSSYHFDNGSGGGVTFEISDGTYTYLTATLAPVDVFSYAPGWSTTAWINGPAITDFNLTNITLGTGFSSQYIDELSAMNIESKGMQFNASLTFTSGDPSMPPYDFNGGNSGGSVNGIVSAPEPVSSILFIFGGGALALRRFFRA